MYKVDITKSKVNIINQLLCDYEGKKHTATPLYKKTIVSFKKKYGIDLQGAPIIFSAGGVLWKLSYTVYQHKGHTFESVTYLPIIACGDKFKRIARPDIKL